MWPNNVWSFWRSLHWTWLLMCPNTQFVDWKMNYMMANISWCVQHMYKLVVFHDSCFKWNIAHEDEPLLIKAKNDIALNKIKELICIVGTKCVTLCAMTLSWPTVKDKLWPLWVGQICWHLCPRRILPNWRVKCELKPTSSTYTTSTILSPNSKYFWDHLVNLKANSSWF